MESRAGDDVRAGRPPKKVGGFEPYSSILVRELSRLPALRIPGLRADGPFGGPAQAGGLGPHGAVLPVGTVVPATQVEEAVGEEHRHLRERGVARRLPLTHGGRDRDDDVAEEPRVEVRELAFALRECEHVRRLVFVPIISVEIVDLFVVNKCD